MLSQKTRVQAIKSKFENLNVDKPPVSTPKQQSQLYKIKNDKENKVLDANNYESDISSDDCLKPNSSYLYKNDVKRSVSDSKTLISRQTSDPSKKLQRSHAFRCDRAQLSPKRTSSCNRSGMDNKLSKDKLKRLGDLLEVQMKKENFVPPSQCSENFDPQLQCTENQNLCPIVSIPDENVPPHILVQYSKVLKPKRQDNNQDAMTDSGVSSETENLEEDRSSRIKKLMNQFEEDKTALPLKLDIKSNLECMDDLAGSSETMKLEKKNPHVVLTDTLKKALKQPLPAGPPPKKPPRIFTALPIPENFEEDKKNTQRKLQKLEKVLEKREMEKKFCSTTQMYDIVEENVCIAKPKEVHYLCTEILDITSRTLLPNQSASPLKNCLGKLNCVTSNSTLSLPYSRLSANINLTSFKTPSNSSDNLLLESQNRDSTCQNDSKCQISDGSHISDECVNRVGKSEFFTKEHIYDEPYVGAKVVNKVRSKYGTLNSVLSQSKSLEDVSDKDLEAEQKVYDIPYAEPSVAKPDTPKINFQQLLKNFENGDVSKPNLGNDVTKKIFEMEAPRKNIFEKRNIDTEISKSNFGSEISKKIENGLKSVKSSESIVDVTKFVKNTPQFGTEGRRNRYEDTGNYGLKKNPQLDVDRENLNRLMNEIYDTVTAAYDMEETKPGSFPTDTSEGSASEESVKLTRSLTEKRKNYVRRVSSRLAYLEPKNIKNTRFRHQTSICSYKSEIQDNNPYSTFRSWKSFRTSQNNLNSKMTDVKISQSERVPSLSFKGDIDVDVSDSFDSSSIDEKAGCVDLELPFEPKENGLFNLCLLVGLNYMNGEAYVKSVFPHQVQVPQHIESLIFPETFSQEKGEWATDAKSTQCYSFVLTDERGERSYGYCRRVVPEGATTCLPLCYCIIGKFRAPGFYYKILQEIESHHGSSEVESNVVLQQLFEADFPNPGEEITITYTKDIKHSATDVRITNSKLGDSKIADSRWGDDKIVDSKLGDSKIVDSRLGDSKIVDSKLGDSKIVDSRLGDKVMESLSGSRNNLMDRSVEGKENNNNDCDVKMDGVTYKVIKRPLEPRAEEVSVSSLLDDCGAGLLVKMFATLLLERKLIVRVGSLSSLSKWVESLQSVLYPFVWQQPLICCVPRALRRDVAAAPVPLLAGMLADTEPPATGVDDGMLIDSTHPSKVLFYQGDESTILPTNSYKTLKTSLQMESLKYTKDDEKTRNVMISEAFLRFFVDILGDFWKFFSIGVMKDGDLGKGDVVFDKEAFVKSSSSKQNQYFLEWFTETAMFNHFIQNMAVRYMELSDSTLPVSFKIIDAPTPNFYQLFEERVQARNNRNSLDRTGYKSALHKRVKMLKARLKDLVG